MCIRRQNDRISDGHLDMNLPATDVETTKRLYEMNEWTVHNKKDTLFVLSSLFIALSALLLLTVLWRMGMSAYTAAIYGMLIVISFVIILIVRSQYTNTIRDQRYWHRENRPKEYGALQISLCPTMPQDSSQA